MNIWKKKVDKGEERPFYNPFRVFSFYLLSINSESIFLGRWGTYIWFGSLNGQSKC